MSWTAEHDREFRELFDEQFSVLDDAECFAMTQPRKPVGEMWYRLAGLGLLLGSVSLVALVVMGFMK